MSKTADAVSLWKLTKSGHNAEAMVRPIDGVGLELRFLWDGDLRCSQLFKSCPELEDVAKAKQEELQARGWS